MEGSQAPGHQTLARAWTGQEWPAGRGRPHTQDTPRQPCLREPSQGGAGAPKPLGVTVGPGITAGHPRAHAREAWEAAADAGPSAPSSPRGPAPRGAATPCWGPTSSLCLPPRPLGAPEGPQQAHPSAGAAPCGPEAWHRVGAQKHGPRAHPKLREAGRRPPCQGPDGSFPGALDGNPTGGLRAPYQDSLAGPPQGGDSAVQVTRRSPTWGPRPWGERRAGQPLPPAPGPVPHPTSAPVS